MKLKAKKKSLVCFNLQNRMCWGARPNLFLVQAVKLSSTKASPHVLGAGSACKGRRKDVPRWPP